MLVCICYGVSDKEIKKLVANGACSVAQVQKHCKAGQKCGTCVRSLAKTIEKTLEQQEKCGCLESSLDALPALRNGTNA